MAPFLAGIRPSFTTSLTPSTSTTSTTTTTSTSTTTTTTITITAAFEISTPYVSKPHLDTNSTRIPEPVPAPSAPVPSSPSPNSEVAPQQRASTTSPAATLPSVAMSWNAANPAPTPHRDSDGAHSPRSSPILLPPPPPPHTTHIPARLSLDLHHDIDTPSGAFDFSGVLSVMGLDSRDGSSNSYDMVSREEDDRAHSRNEARRGVEDSGVLVDRYAMPVSPLAVMNRSRNGQLDGSADRHWECVSVGDSAAGEEGGMQRPDGTGMRVATTRPQLRTSRTYYSPPTSQHPQDILYEHVQTPEPIHEQLRSQSAAGDFFKDFDGVHYSPDSAPPRPPTAPLCSDQQVYIPYRPQQLPQPISYPIHAPDFEPSQKGGLVYYPAPVPAFLNLPPLMAKDKGRNRASKVQKRASQQVLSDSSSDVNGNRRSMGWGVGGAPGEDPRSSVINLDDPQRLANLPPALRASAYFDSMYPPVKTVVPEHREASAVDTLDSILDASANAPAAAFTDHPMTGAMSSSHLPLRGERRNSVAVTVMLHPGESCSSLDEFEQQMVDAVEEESKDILPTTLLAELESRKKKLRLRTRTAAAAFPSGIRSTLLEMDAVAQVQAQSRRARRTHLAWEDPDGQEDEEEDEDVPLGILFQDAARAASKGRDEDVPLGLLLQRQVEDAEPLSKRRERLLGHNGSSHLAPQLAAPMLEDEEVEEETLAQRMKRLKDSKHISTFGDGSLELSFSAGGPGASAPPEDETLAQRRKRLREEDERKRLGMEAKAIQTEIRKRQSMATIMQQSHEYQHQQQYGVGGGMGGGIMGRSTPMLPGVRPGSMGADLAGGPGLIHQAGVVLLRPQMSLGNMNSGMMFNPNAGTMNGRGQSIYGMPSMGMQGPNGVGMARIGMTPGAGGTMPLTPQEVAVNNKQRDMVERWRASVM